MSRLLGIVAPVVLLLTTPSILLADHHETSTPEEFKEFGDLMSGRWVVDVTLIADWPGLKERKGEKITGYEEHKWTLDGKILEGKGFGGTGVNKIIYAYDRSSKQIRYYWFTSGGLVGEGIQWKKSPGVFAWRTTRGEMTGSGENRFSDAGKKMTSVSDDLKLGDEELDDLKDVYTKVSPN